MLNKFSVIKTKISQFNNQRIDFNEKFMELHEEIHIFIKDFPEDLPEKKEIISFDEKVIHSFKRYTDIVDYFNDELESIRGVYKKLISYSDNDEIFSKEFIKFKSKISQLENSFFKGISLFALLEEDYNKLELSYNHLILNYDYIVKSLHDQQESQINSQEDNNEIEDVLLTDNDSSEVEINAQDEFIELDNILIFGNDVEEQNNEFLVKFKNYVDGPFYGLMCNSFEFSDDEEMNILNEIESDIIQGKIKDGNVENIIKERFKNHTQNDYVENLKERLNSLINDSKFYRDLSNEYVDLSDIEKQECINELIKTFNLDFKENDIETTLNVLFEDKRKQKHDLSLLDKYKNNIDLCAEKYNLDKNEILEIFNETQKDIIESKLFGMEFGEYITRKFRDKVDENKIKAVNQLISLYNKKSILKEVTHLDDKKLLIAFKNIELLISKNKVKHTEINEELVVEYSMIILTKKIYSEVYDGT